MKLKTIFIIYAVIILIVGVGWIKNIAKLSNCDFEAPYRAEIIHVIGLLPPIGMVTGWLNPGK